MASLAAFPGVTTWGTSLSFGRLLLCLEAVVPGSGTGQSSFSVYVGLIGGVIVGAPHALSYHAAALFLGSMDLGLEATQVITGSRVGSLARYLIPD